MIESSARSGGSSPRSMSSSFDVERSGFIASPSTERPTSWLSRALLASSVVVAIALAFAGGVSTGAARAPAFRAPPPVAPRFDNGGRPMPCPGNDTQHCLNHMQPSIARYQYDVDAHRAVVGGKELGHGVIVAPQKLGGGVSAVDLRTGRSLASLWYSNYGDYGAIPHHIIAFPSADPYDSFEFINSCQGGKNTHLYGLQNVDPDPPAATNVYRLRYDGTTLMIAENVSDTTGLGLGVHTTINPADAESFAVSDGQKDVFAVFDRRTTAVRAAFRYDWVGRDKPALKDNWEKGGTLRVTRIYPDARTGRFDMLGAKGNKIDVELAPMAEGDLELGRIAGADQAGTVAADGFVYHPSGKYGVEIVRMLGGGVLHDVESTEEFRARAAAGTFGAALKGDAAPNSDDHQPRYFFSFNKGVQTVVPLERKGRDTWEAELEAVPSPGHELGFSPDGKHFLMMINLKANAISIIDSSDPDPANWRPQGYIQDPLWSPRSLYPNPFHMAFSHDSKTALFVVLRPKPQRSNLMVVNLETMHIVKELQGVARDMQSIVTSMDGRFAYIITGGFQRFESSLLVFDMETLEVLGSLPAPGGHHDLALVPQTVEQMKYTRAICM